MSFPDHGVNRKVVDNGTNRIVTDYAGNGNWGDRDGDALSAELGGLQSIVIDSNDNIYVTTWNRVCLLYTSPSPRDS